MRVAYLWAVLVCLACDAGPGTRVLDLPPRPPGAPSGGEVIRDIRGLDLEVREERIYAEVARGNVPGWFRQLVPVEMTSDVAGQAHRVTFWVTPDYLAVGSDSDFFLAPLSPRMAQRIAALVRGALPTPRMVDAVWASAGVRLIPIRIPPNEHRWTVRYFERHGRLVRAQARQHGARPGDLIAGHKLDVVRSATPGAGPGEVALYGWHQTDGTPIQPLYPVPVDSRAHFSMGIRLVDREILVDGTARDLVEVLRDPQLAPLLARDEL